MKTTDDLLTFLSQRPWAREHAHLAPEEIWRECPRADWLVWVAECLRVDHSLLLGACLRAIYPVLGALPDDDDRVRYSADLLARAADEEIISPDLQEEMLFVWDLLERSLVHLSPLAIDLRKPLMVVTSLYHAFFSSLDGSPPFFDYVPHVAGDWAALYRGQGYDAQARYQYLAEAADAVRDAIPFAVVAEALHERTTTK